MPFELPPPRLRKWTRASSERVGDYRVFAVDHHAMRDAAGRPRKDVYTFSCPDWCNVVAITDADELVLIWQYRHGTDALSLEVPGGVVEPEEDPLVAARRELREETGFDAPSLEPLLVVEPNPALQNNRCFTYLARGARRVGETAFDESEECELVLVPAKHAADLLDGGFVSHSLVVCALEAYVRRSASSGAASHRAGHGR